MQALYIPEDSGEAQWELHDEATQKKFRAMISCLAYTRMFGL